MDLQKRILSLNYYACVKALTLPKNIIKSNGNEQLKLESFFSYLSNKKTKFNSSIDVLHPNLLRYLITNNICTINRRKNYCYLENKGGERITISKQNWFGYQLIENLRKSKKKLFKKFFDEDGYIRNLRIEKWSKSWNGVKRFRRIDFLFDIGDEDNERFIALEYLENHHEEELINQNQYQTIRIVDILFGEFKDKISHFLFVWDKLWDDNEYQNKITKHLYKKIKDFDEIDNEDKYIIKTLSQWLGKKFSKLVFDAYKNENKCVIPLNNLKKLFNIKDIEIVTTKFKKIVEQLTKFQDSNQDFSFDSDSDEEDNKDNNLNYYTEKNNELYLSNNGLMVFLKEISCQDCQDVRSYESIIIFHNKLGKTAYESVRKIMELNLKLKEELIYGLDDII